MAELNFKGKEFVYNHHLAVPFRPLEIQPEKGVGAPNLEGNLIIQGDNLHALKSLLPRYANKVDCIFIDPPYNTGNEGWCYNDNVNAPMIKEWLNTNPIGIEDGLYHDKWCAMMWPRLRLLHELLAKTGVVFVCIDDNEHHTLRFMMDEIFGTENFVASIVWHHRKSGQNDIDISLSHNHIVCYAAMRKNFKFNPGEVDQSKFSNPDNDPRGPWVADPMDAPNVRANLSYAIINPNTQQIYYPPAGRHWRFSENKFKDALNDERIIFGKTGNSRPQYKRFLSEAKERGTSIFTIWDDVGTATSATKDLQQLFDGKSVFPTPKPVELIERIIDISTNTNATILDSFAGSGTTAHAVLQANKRDGGSRCFILVEMENYADQITAERVRRVINGFSFKGKQKTELIREKLTWPKIRNATKLIEKVQLVENLHRHEYDTIRQTVKGTELIIIGEKAIDEFTDGLGGEFTFCTLGESVELDKLLSGESLPPYEDIGAVLFHMATNRPIDLTKINEEEWYLGEGAHRHVWLIYKPEIEWLKSPDSALTLNRAKKIATKSKDATHLVFAPARYVSQKMLNEQEIRVEFVPLPYGLYRIDRS